MKHFAFRRSNGQRFLLDQWKFPPCVGGSGRFVTGSKKEVEKELTGWETEPWEIYLLKLHKSQIPLVEEAIKTANLMLGRDKRGYCLERSAQPYK
jgi:hypothetical protein